MSHLAHRQWQALRGLSDRLASLSTGHDRPSMLPDALHAKLLRDGKTTEATGPTQQLRHHRPIGHAAPTAAVGEGGGVAGGFVGDVDELAGRAGRGQAGDGVGGDGDGAAGGEAAGGLVDYQGLGPGGAVGGDLEVELVVAGEAEFGSGGEVGLEDERRRVGG